MRVFMLVVAFIVLSLLAACGGNLANGEIKQVSDSAKIESWNAHCSSCNFDYTSSASEFTTFGEMYNGFDFYADIQVMDMLISHDLGFPAGLGDVTPDKIFWDEYGEDID